MSIIGAIGSQIFGNANSSVTAAGSTLATATLLLSGFNVVTTATSLQGVQLQTALIGDCQIVFNNTSVAVTVYPYVSTARINQIALGGGHVLAAYTACMYLFASSTQHIGFLSA